MPPPTPLHKPSVFQTIPNELLSEILEAAVYEGPNNVNPHAIMHAQNFTLVSKRWRGVALTTPRLWNQISFTWTVLTCRSAPSILAQLCLALKLSAAVPLLVDITFNCSSYLEDTPMLPSLLAQLLDSSDRWLFLSIRFSSRIPKYFDMLSDRRGRFSQLTALRVGEWGMYGQPFIASLFAHAPRLAFVETTDFSSRLETPINQITQIESEDEALCISLILSNLHAVQSVCLTPGGTTTHLDRLTRVPARAETVHTLTITTTVSRQLSKTISFPNLKSLRIVLPSRLGEEFQSLFTFLITPFITATKSLEELHLVTIDSLPSRHELFDIVLRTLNTIPHGQVQAIRISTSSSSAPSPLASAHLVAECNQGCSEPRTILTSHSRLPCS